MAEMQIGGWYNGRQWNGQTLGPPGVINMPGQPGYGQPVSEAAVRQTNPANVAYLNQLRYGTPISSVISAPVNTAGSAGQRGSSYTVRPGDSLSKIGRMYGVSWQQIYSTNKTQIRNPNLIYPGQRLSIPTGGRTSTLTPIPTPVPTPSPEAYQNYQQSKGWSLIKPAYAAENYYSLIQKYFPPSQWQNAYKIMMAESGGKNIPSYYNQFGTENSWGPFQINLDYHPQMADKVLDPEENVKYAAQLWSQQGWRPWTNSANKLGISMARPGKAESNAYNEWLKKQTQPEITPTVAPKAATPATPATMTPAPVPGPTPYQTYLGT